MRAALVWGLIAAIPLVDGGFPFGCRNSRPSTSAGGWRMSPHRRVQVAAFCHRRLSRTEPGVPHRDGPGDAAGAEVPAFLYARGRGLPHRLRRIARRKPVFGHAAAPIWRCIGFLAGVRGININGGRNLDIGVWIKR
jgi:hypothetical protein